MMNVNKKDNSASTINGSRRGFIKKVVWLPAVASLVSQPSIASLVSVKGVRTKKDDLCCMQLLYMQSVDAGLRRRTNELYGDLDKKEFREKLKHEFYIPASRKVIDGDLEQLSSVYADELVRRSGHVDADILVAEFLGTVSYETALGSSSNIDLRPSSVGIYPKLNMTEQNTLTQVMHRLAFDQQLSGRLAGESSLDVKKEIISGISSEFGNHLSSETASWMSAQIAYKNDKSLKKFLGENLYAATW